jgi:hypothetical protein
VEAELVAHVGDGVGLGVLPVLFDESAICRLFLFRPEEPDLCKQKQLVFSTGISEIVSRFFATCIGNVVSWKLSHRLPTFSLEHLSLYPVVLQSLLMYAYLDHKYL